MKILLVLSLLFTQLTWAQSKPSPKNVDFTQEEVNQYLRTAKAQKVEEQLSESDLFKACKDDESIQTQKDMEACIQSKVWGEDFDAEEFADKIDLKSYDLEASRDTKSIKAYLSERIQKAIYGEQDDDKKLKKIADHNIFNKLYRSQVGKNILMEVSNYCLVNLGIKDHPNVLVHQGIDIARRGRDEVLNTFTDSEKAKVFQGRATAFSDSLQGSKISLLDKDGNELTANTLMNKFVQFNETADPNDSTKKTYTPQEITIKKFSDVGFSDWTDAFEYEICDNKDGSACEINVEKKDGTSEKIKMRTTDMIKAMKEVEFQLGPKYMKQKYQFCAFSAINHMCELYKCSFEYTANTIGEKKKYCTANFNINPDEDLSSRANIPSHKVGLKACGLVAKLKQYRKALTTLDVLDEHNKKLYNKRGFHGSTYAGGFHGTKGDDSVEDITTVSSHDLTENTKLGLDEEEIEKLRDECLSSGSLSEEEKCQALIQDIDELDAVAEHEAETQAYMKRVDTLNDKESLKEYLIKNGLHKYAAQVETMDDDILKQLIKDEYKSEREALKQSMMEKFNRLTKKSTATTGGAHSGDDFEENIEDVAETSIQDLEKKKERIQTLFQYNNVISSYMEAEYEDSGDKTDLSYIREAELQGVKRYDESRADEYDRKLNDGQESTARKGGESLGIDIQFIDQLLNN